MRPSRPDRDPAALEPATPLESGVVASVSEAAIEAADAPRIGPKPMFSSLLGMLRARPLRALRFLLFGGDQPDFFRAPVRWLFGRDLLTNLRSIALYGAFGDELDHRDWMQTEVIDLRDEPREEGGFWFDYVADTGDGQLAMYDMAQLLLADAYVDEQQPSAAVSLEAGRHRLPRGRFLFCGGDTAYHVADDATLEARMCAPFEWARRELPARPEQRARWVFGIPGNHDYYDSLIGFNRLFRAPDNPRLPLADLQRRQQASFVALQLPFEFLLLGLDSQNGKLDRRQRQFMLECLHAHGSRRLIVATPEPATVFDVVKRDAARPFDALGLPRPFSSGVPSFPAPDALHLDLSGDTHHYARYADQAHPNFAYVVAGGGGAFVHPSHTRERRGDAPPAWPPTAAALYPSADESRRVMTARLLCPWRILSGGGVFFMGALLSLLLYFGVAFAPGMHELFVQEILPRSELESPAGRWAFAPSASSVHRVVDAGPDRAHGRTELLTSELATLSALIVVLLWASVLSPRLFAQATERDEAARPAVRASRYAGLCGGALVTLACMGVTYYERATLPGLDAPRPFFASFLLLLYLTPLPLAGFWIVNYLGTLPKQAKVRPLHELDSLPRWIALLFGVGSAIYGLLSYGVNSVAAFGADLGAIIALGVLVVAPTAMAYAQGSGRSLRRRLGYACIGLCFGALQLMLPLLLAIYGDALDALSCAAWSIGIGALGHFLYCRWPRAWILLGAWLAAGGGALAWILISAELQPVDGASFALACAAGGVFACVWFGFYLAVALAFDAHNNEAGGAARIDFYRHFVRIKLERDRLTGYVIGFDRPATAGARAKLIDVFELVPEAQEQ
jgi:hypothetical protein